ncbi:MAG: SGNH/GDSL hydrolase family protein [Chitinophagaceae bacterium]|nr:SGNH/GDSL hydrolase family protein [Chitinophagaceae bacterium]
MIKPIACYICLLSLLPGCSKPDTRAGFVTSSPVVPSNPTVVLPDTTVTRTYLALGDSYTIGQSVAFTERFPVQTVALLGSQSIKFNQPEIIAQTGWTTGDLLSKLNNNPPSKSIYDIVSLLIGVNNQYQHRTQDEYRQQFIILLERSILYTGNNKRKVFVLSIPDYSVTPYASGSDRDLIARQIDSFNVINKTISQQYQVNYLDITGDTRLASTNLSLIAGDGLHPSGAGYTVWAAKLAPMIKLVLQ